MKTKLIILLSLAIICSIITIIVIFMHGFANDEKAVLILLTIAAIYVMGYSFFFLYKVFKINTSECDGLRDFCWQSIFPYEEIFFPEPIYDLQEDRIIPINGVAVKWFVGDFHLQRAIRLGDVSHNAKTGKIIYHNHATFSWVACGSCNGKMYQAFAWASMVKKDGKTIIRIKEIKVQDDRSNYYFDEETYKMLTEPKQAPVNDK